MRRVTPNPIPWLFVLLVAPLALAERTHEITVEDYFTISLITDLAVSPDGRYVAFVEQRWEGPDEPRSSELWVVQTATRSDAEMAPARLTRLTFEHVNDDQPQWSHDSQYIYFVTKRDRQEKLPPYDGSTQVWRTTPAGGEPFAITRVKGGIQAYELSRDGRTLYYTKEGEEAAYNWKDLRKKHASIEYGDGPVKYTELWQLDLETWRAEQVVAPQRVIRSFAVAPDGDAIALITAPDDRLITNEGQSRVDLYVPATKDLTPLPDELYRKDVPSPHGWVENLAWSDDARRLAWTVDFDGFPGEILVAEFADTGETPVPQVHRLTRPGEIHCAGRLKWVPDSHDLCFSAERRARIYVACIPDIDAGQQGEMRLLTPDDGVAYAYDFGGDGAKLAYVFNPTTHAGDIYLSELKSGQPQTRPARLTRLNPQVDTWKLPQIKLVQWQAPDGTDVEGILELPPDWKEGDPPLPMVVELHGGPTDATRYRLRYWIYGRTLLATKGYALLSPNYRGSTGYGDKFLTDLIGREADIEVKDVLAGVEAMIARGIADPQRLGVMGWSNGGFLTNAIIVQTDRFKAASTGAGVVDQVMQWGLEDTPGHVVNYMKGLPWQRAEHYFEASAIYKLDRVKTPTLIHVGEKDSRVPAAHCRTLYRGLKDYVGVPTELVVYPGAGHGLVVYNHRKAKMDWDLAWFDKYLLGQNAPPPTKPKPPGAEVE